MPTYSSTHVVRRICPIAKNDARSPLETVPCTHKDEVAASDLRSITSGDTLSLPAELGAGQVTIYPAHKVASQAAEAGKRSARTSAKQTPNVRPRARARTEEESDSKLYRVDVVSGGSSAVTSGQSSEGSSRVFLGTRSGRVRTCASMSGVGTNRKRRGSFPVCSLEKSGSSARWAMGGKGPCEDCGGGFYSHWQGFFVCRLPVGRIMLWTRVQGREAKIMIREGRREAKKRKKPHKNCRRDVGNEGGLGGNRKNVDKEVSVSSC